MVLARLFVVSQVLFLTAPFALGVGLYVADRTDNGFVPFLFIPRLALLLSVLVAVPFVPLPDRALAQTAPAWSVGRITAAERCAVGTLRAAATPRIMQAYAIGR